MVRMANIGGGTPGRDRHGGLIIALWRLDVAERCRAVARMSSYKKLTFGLIWRTSGNPD